MAAGIEAHQVNLDAPFRSAEHAVSYAYATEASAIIEVSSYLSDLRGSTVPLPGREPLSAYDRHTQAAMILAFVAARLDPLEQLVLRARHTRLGDSVLAKRKDADIHLLYEFFVHGHEPRNAPAEFRDYALDAMRGWARMPREHKEWWWADRFDCDIKTLWRWRWADRRYKRRGFLYRIEGAYRDAVANLADPMREAGLTQE